VLWQYANGIDDSVVESSHSRYTRQTVRWYFIPLLLQYSM
jgi:hypothetical protein